MPTALARDQVRLSTLFVDKMCSIGMAQNRPNLKIETLPMRSWPSEVYPLEPVQGWIQRAAKKNYAFSVDTFIDSLGLSGRDWDYDELLKIAEQLPIAGYAELESSTPKRREEGYEMCQHKVPFRFISKKRRRVCAMCLEERPYVRNWFDLVLVASCPHHDVALMEGLPGDPLDWRHPEVGWTRNGTKLGAKHATVQFASKLDHFIVGSVSGERIRLPEHLDGISLDVIFAASICIGKLHCGDSSHDATHERLRDFCQRGFEPLTGGSEAIIAFLRKADWLQPSYNKARYVDRSKSIYGVLDSIKDHRLRQLVADSFARVRVRNGLNTPSGRLSKYDGEDDLLSLKSAARRLGISTYTLSKLLDRLSIESKKCERNHLHRLSREQIAMVQRYIDDTFSAADVSVWLGCSPLDLESLVKRKLLTAEFSKDGQRYYSKSSIEFLIAEMNKDSVNMYRDDSEYLNKFVERVGISIPEAVSRIIREKSLIVVFYDAERPLFTGMKVIDAGMICLDARDKLKRQAIVRPSAQFRAEIPLAEAEARIGTNFRGLKQLIELGYLKAEPRSPGRYAVCEKSLADFQKKFVKAADYSFALKCHPTKASKLLSDMGVQPINPGPGMRIKFFSKDEVKRVAGIELIESDKIRYLRGLEPVIINGLRDGFVPATVRVNNDPTITVRATSGRWSFRISVDEDTRVLELRSSFTAKREPHRLQRFSQKKSDPGTIWPSAKVLKAAGGGFELLDLLHIDAIDPSDAKPIVDHITRRALELHAAH